MTWVPSWLVDFCTFSGAVWWSLLMLSLGAFLILAAIGSVRERFRRRREASRVIDAAERFTKEAVQ